MEAFQPHILSALPDDLNDEQKDETLIEILAYVARTTNIKPVQGDEAAVVIHGHGPYGAGKTKLLQAAHQALGRDQNFFFNGDDEYGAIEAISLFKQELAAAEDYESRLAVGDRYRSVSALIHDLVKNNLILKRINHFSDSTSTSPYTIEGFDLYAENGFQNWMMSSYAPYSISKDRCMDSLRTLTIDEELIGKRMAALSNFMDIFHHIKKEGGAMSLHYNPDNDGEPQFAFLLAGGALQDRNDTVIEKILADLEKEKSEVEFGSVREEMDKAIQNYINNLNLILKMDIPTYGPAQQQPEGSTAPDESDPSPPQA